MKLSFTALAFVAVGASAQVGLLRSKLVLVNRNSHMLT